MHMFFFSFLLPEFFYSLSVVLLQDTVLYMYMYLFSTISLLHLDPCMLHLFIFTVSACVCMFVCMVHHCTWACYLLATLLGLAVGQNILRALTFPGSPTPPSLFSFPRLLAIQEYASQVLGNLHAALLPSSTSSLIRSYSFSSVCSFPISLFSSSHLIFASFCPIFSPHAASLPLSSLAFGSHCKPTACSGVCS